MICLAVCFRKGILREPHVNMYSGSQHGPTPCQCTSRSSEQLHCLVCVTCEQRMCGLPARGEQPCPSQWLCASIDQTKQKLAKPSLLFFLCFVLFRQKTERNLFTRPKLRETTILHYPVKKVCVSLGSRCIFRKTPPKQTKAKTRSTTTKSKVKFAPQCWSAAGARKKKPPDKHVRPNIGGRISLYCWPERVNIDIARQTRNRATNMLD